MRYRFPSASMECPKYAWKVFNFLVLWRPFSVISDYNVTFTHINWTKCRIYLLHKQTSNFCPSVGRKINMGTLEPDDQEAGKML